MIFPGEEIQWEKEKQTTVHASDSKINEKYMAGEVRIVTEQARYPLDTITGMVSSGKYNLMPTFQRRHRWDDEKKSRLIESFIYRVYISFDGLDLRCGFGHLLCFNDKKWKRQISRTAD